MFGGNNGLKMSKDVQLFLGDIFRLYEIGLNGNGFS